MSRQARKAAAALYAVALESPEAIDHALRESTKNLPLHDIIEAARQAANQYP